jgi:hypothetical protein
MSNHLNILHIPFTGIKKIDEVAEIRLNNLMYELSKQGIADYSIIEGFYDAKNTKQAIHKGHRRIVELAKKNNLDRVLIAEDDIVFTHPNSFNYFLSQIPESFDIFSGLVYSATMEGNRIKNGGSGMTSLYVVNSRFYDFFLSMNIDNHIDRELGLTAYKHEYYVCQPMPVIQRGGFSINKKQTLFYDAYLQGKKLYNG